MIFQRYFLTYVFLHTSTVLWAVENKIEVLMIYKNPVMTFPIKIRIYTALFIDKTAALTFGSEREPIKVIATSDTSRLVDL